MKEDRKKTKDLLLRLTPEVHARLEQITALQHGNLTAQVVAYILRGLKEDETCLLEINDEKREDSAVAG